MGSGDSTSDAAPPTLVDADVLWRALDRGAPEHAEAWGILEQFRTSQQPIAVTDGILGEVYAQLRSVGKNLPRR